MREAEDQGHKRKCSQKKKFFKNFFQAISKKIFKIIFQAFSSIKRLPKFLFRRSSKFQQFKKKCCPRAEDRAIFEDLRPRGQGQGLDLRGQGQGRPRGLHLW